MCTPRAAGQDRETHLRQEDELVLLQLMLALKHPNIVACKEAFQQHNTLHILLEHCSQGETLFFQGFLMTISLIDSWSTWMKSVLGLCLLF